MIDCPLALSSIKICFGEKRLAKCLSPQTATVLALINEVLASDKDALTPVWNQKHPAAKMKAEHGSRFSHISTNAANENHVKSESQSIASCS